MAESSAAAPPSVGAPGLAVRVEALVLGAEPLGPFRLLRLDPGAGPAPAPGRFAMVRDPDADELLPWPLAPVPHPAGGTGLLVPADGGPSALAAARRLVLLGPLGHGYELAGLDASATLLVAAGHGAALLAGVRGALGAGSRLLVPGDEGDEATAAALVGAPAERVAPEALARRLRSLVDGDAVRHVLVAAPDAPTREVVAVCGAAGVHAQVALEAPMACGFGACFGCAVRLDGSWRRLCLEGPVVDARRLAAT